MKRGLTLIECLVCFAIFIVVAGISYPVLASAKRAALGRASVSDMRQIAVAAQIYREDWKRTEYGGMEEMGLPFFYAQMFGHPRATSGWPVPPIKTPSLSVYYWMANPEAEDGRVPSWKEFVLQHQDRTVLLCDPAFEGMHGSQEMAWQPSFQNRIRGVSLDGSLITKKPYGNFFDLSRWIP
jgi:type II secretory pathway pseudopilin PulG